MAADQGTPKTLDHAIVNIVCFHPVIGKSLKDYAYYILKDFLAQKFGVAYLQASTEQLKCLESLYQEIIRREE